MDEQTVKDFLRIDSSEDISFYVDTAVEYVKEAVGVVDEEDPLTRYAICMITQELYDHRTYTGEYSTTAQQNRVRHAAYSILEQIRLRNLAKEAADES